jgi:hydroxyacylglutathione hydrolase
MIVHTVIVGDFQTNAYVVHSEGSEKALVVDAPGPADEIVSLMKKEGLTAEVLVVTHAHIDHLSGMADLRFEYPEMKMAAGEDASRMLGRPTMNLSLFLGKAAKFPDPDILLTNGCQLKAGGLDFEVRVVTGHAPGSVCLFQKDDPPTVFTGDTLFAGSVGRSDLPGGDMNDLIEKIRERIMSLPEETVVYPGHGPQTSIGDERSNPFLV